MRERDAFEDELVRALRDGAESGPTSTVGLAAGARARRRSRVRRRLGGAAVVAVLAVVVPLAVLGRPDDGDRSAGVVAADGPAPDDGAWRTVTLDGGHLLDLPPDWVADARSDCAFPVPGYVSPEVDRCSMIELVTAYGSATFDARLGPGLRPGSDYPASHGVADDTWSGYVSAGDQVVYVESRDLALRVLGSVRPDGVAAPDLTGEWTTQRAGPYDVLVPSGVDLDVELAGEPTRRERGELSAAHAQQDRGGWTASVVLEGQPVVLRVHAPTAALAELVAGSARVARR